jgi:hypothetical protein
MGNDHNQEELEYHSEYEDKIYGKGELFSSSKIPNCYLMKKISLLSNQEQFRLLASI